jgi:hypothetical protein
MNGYQILEAIIVAILFLLQCYVCYKVIKLTRRISTFLSNKDILSLKVQDIKK